MTDVLIETIAQWGTAGIFVIAGGFLLWDSWKKNKKFEQFFMDKVSAQASREKVGIDLSSINTKLDTLQEDQRVFREDIRNRIASVEAKIDKYHPDHHHMEAARMEAVSKIAPSIHTLINEGLNSCNCDHIAVALLHNGQVALSGVPYIKFGVIAEKYKPIHYPNDIDLVIKYKEEDIVSHNRLPSCMLHNRSIRFDISPDSPLVDIDPIVYNRCQGLGIRQIAFEMIRDAHNLATGFVMIYSFRDEQMDMNSLHSTTDTIEDLYREMLAGFNS